MASRPKSQEQSPLFTVSAGNWTGEFINAGTVSYGLMDQPGPPEYVVEFSYLIAPVILKTPDNKDAAGVMMLTTEPRAEAIPAPGWVFTSGNVPGVTVSLSVNRAQLTDIVRHLENKRLKEFSFALTSDKEEWRITSWNITVHLRDQ